jgi:hypothetical protein
VVVLLAGVHVREQTFRRRVAPARVPRTSTMKPLFAASLFLLPSLLALTLPSAAWLGPDPTFREKFKKLMEKGQKPEEEKLVKAESSNAAAWIVRFDEILADRPDDPDAGAVLAELSSAWTAAMKSEFPAKEKQFFTQMDAKSKHDRVDLRKRFDKAQSDFDSNADKKDAWVYTQLVDEVEVLANAFDQINDMYWASEAWLIYAACYDEPLRGNTADLKRAFSGYEKALAARAAVDLADTKKDAAEKRKTALAGKGGDKGAAGTPAPTSQEPTDAGATVTVPLAFEMLPTFDAFQRPNYLADENYVTWHELALKGKGSTVGFENTPGAPTLYRIGSSDVRIDSDGDGRGDGPNDEKVPLTGNITPVKVALGKGDAARPWAFFVTPAGQQELYQGVSLNMSASDDRYRIFILGAATVTGTLEGTPIRIIDDSMDGVYGNEPQSYGFAGLVKGEYQPDMDSIVVGAGKHARPWSEFQKVGDKWWKFEMSSEGKEIKASPIKTDTGILKLEFKGPVQPTYVVVRGTNTLKNAFFDLVEGGAKGVEVPVGRYTLCYGELRKGKKKQMQKCVILPGAHNAISYDVTKDKPTVVTLGAPFSMDFESKADEGKVTIKGTTVVVTGSAGEHYERAWQCVPQPEAAWRKKGTKSAAKSAKMPPLQDSHTIETLGFEAAWFPLDLTMETKGATDVEVQLSEKKHELFGKIESDWK